MVNGGAGGKLVKVVEMDGGDSEWWWRKLVVVARVKVANGLS